jgi:hypothetical protein
MRISQDLREAADGMARKSREFVELGSRIYVEE